MLTRPRFNRARPRGAQAEPRASPSPSITPAKYPVCSQPEQGASPRGAGIIRGGEKSLFGDGYRGCRRHAGTGGEGSAAACVVCSPLRATPAKQRLKHEIHKINLISCEGRASRGAARSEGDTHRCRARFPVGPRVGAPAQAPLGNGVGKSSPQMSPTRSCAANRSHPLPCHEARAPPPATAEPRRVNSSSCGFLQGSWGGGLAAHPLPGGWIPLLGRLREV